MKSHGMDRLLSLFLATSFVFATVGSAQAKSLYVNRDLNSSSPIRAYDIQPGPTYLAFQADSTPTRYGGVGLAIAVDTLIDGTKQEILFVTFEFSGTLDVVNAKTLAIGSQVTAPGASNLAGIVVDQENSKVYTVDRGTQKLYVYSWDPEFRTLTLDGGAARILPEVAGYGAYGLALDEANDVLYVADYSTAVKTYKTSDWSFAGSVPVSVNAVGIAVDEKRGYLYTGSIGNYDLSQYDLVAGTEKTVTIGALPGVSGGEHVCGIAVDLDTGLVYATTRYNSDAILVFDAALTFLCSTGDIGNPTGIVVPREQVSYNPLNLAKGDGVHDADDNQTTEVHVGDLLTYTVSYDNSSNPYDVTEVSIVDSLPPHVSYVSASGGGVYDSATHTITWSIGNVPAGDPGGSFTVEVTVDTAAAGTTITNAVVIGSKETPQTTVNRSTDIAANRPPVADAGDDQTVECALCPDGLGTPVTLDGSDSFDPDDDELSFEWTIPDPDNSGEVIVLATGETPTVPFALGETTVTLTVTDEYGAEDSDTVVILVQDTTDPVIQCSADPNELWPPNHKMRSVFITLDVSDACTLPEDILLHCFVSSNEPDDDPNGDGTTTGDVDGQDGFTQDVDVSDSFVYNPENGCWEAVIFLRAEREGDGTGRVYTIEATVFDVEGNMGMDSCEVTVPHDKGKNKK